MPDPVEISRAVAQIAERSQRIVQEFLSRQASEAPSADPFNISGAFVEMTTKLFSDPTRLLRAQVSLWNDYLRLWQRTAERFFGGAQAEEAAASDPVIATPRGDRRFQDPAWQENTLFDFIKQSYLLTARFMQSATREIEGLDDKSMRKVDFYTRQFVDALAPSNFIMTNPTVLRETIDTGGENLVKGLTNMLDDLERGHGRLAIRMADPSAFKLGETIATTPGKVVFQNDLMQLIQFEPTTETVRKRPLLVIPAWINKYYILDLKAKNSFVRWAVAQGHTVFIISWVNPDERLGQKGFDDYMVEGPLAALDAIKNLTGESEVNAV
ncbi:MAG TPA: class I poly(R)-hydroxyalkanoic acid synthase, partial [Stellaceae bacterium]|nr:class I poly(R)-hydroxyalkanoic acid synthase [Stellaceae bacterium]